MESALDTTKVGKELLRLDYFWGPLRLTVQCVFINIYRRKKTDTDNAGHSNKTLCVGCSSSARAAIAAVIICNHHHYGQIKLIIKIDDDNARAAQPPKNNHLACIGSCRLLPPPPPDSHFSEQKVESGARQSYTLNYIYTHQQSAIIGAAGITEIRNN